MHSSSKHQLHGSGKRQSELSPVDSTVLTQGHTGWLSRDPTIQICQCNSSPSGLKNAVWAGPKCTDLFGVYKAVKMAMPVDGSFMNSLIISVIKSTPKHMFLLSQPIRTTNIKFMAPST